jgi:hypothetical protein
MDLESDMNRLGSPVYLHKSLTARLMHSLEQSKTKLFKPASQLKACGFETPS